MLLLRRRKDCIHIHTHHVPVDWTPLVAFSSFLYLFRYHFYYERRTKKIFRKRDRRRYHARIFECRSSPIGWSTIQRWKTNCTSFIIEKRIQSILFDSIERRWDFSLIIVTSVSCLVFSFRFIECIEYNIRWFIGNNSSRFSRNCYQFTETKISFLSIEIFQFGR